MKLSKIIIVSLMVVVWLITQADSAEARRRAKGKAKRNVDQQNSPVKASLEFDLDHGENNQYKISNISFSCLNKLGQDFSQGCPKLPGVKLLSGSLVNVGGTKEIQYNYQDDQNSLTLKLPLCDPIICKKGSTPVFSYDTAPFDDPTETSFKDNVLFYPYEINSVPDGLDDITKLDDSSTLPSFFASPSGGPSGFVLFADATFNNGVRDFTYTDIQIYVPRINTPTSENNSIALLSSNNANSIPEPSTVAGWLLVGALGLKQLRGNRE